MMVNRMKASSGGEVSGTGPMDEMAKLALRDKTDRAREALVEPERKFDSEVLKRAARYGDSIEFKYVGPAPPYSFVNRVVTE